MFINIMICGYILLICASVMKKYSRNIIYELTDLDSW